MNEGGLQRKPGAASVSCAGRWNTLKKRHHLEGEVCETALMQHADRRPDADASLANFADPSILENGGYRKKN